jgi:hypothetical protein
VSESNHCPDLPDGSVATKSVANTSIPLPLPTIDYAAFRQSILGLSDPAARTQSVGEKEAVKQDAIRFCTILAYLFSDDLDRVTLWGRIGSAFETALAKVGSDSDLDRFADLCLDHVKAEAGKSAACDALTTMRQTWEARPVEWRNAFLAYIRMHRYAVLTHGRARWDGVKEGAVAL